MTSPCVSRCCQILRLHQFQLAGIAGRIPVQGILFRGYDRRAEPQSSQSEENAGGERLHGIWPVPDKKYRDGKEQVSYEQFYHELINSCCGANLLTYIGKVSLQELYDAGFSLGEVIIPKGNCCGIFSSMYGGGSLLEMELLKDVRLKLECQGLSRIPLPS